jgi:SseB protein N-terminal domain
VTGAPGGAADSAGVPWAGRTLTPQPFAGDDGTADPALAAALETGDPRSLAAALASARVLVPVVAVLGDEPAPAGPSGLPADKAADMAVAVLVAPDGTRALPVFSSLTTLTAWSPSARPVPAEGTRAALSAVRDGCSVLVVDPAGPRTAVVRRPAVWALAQGRPWLPPAEDPEVLAAVRAAAASPEVAGVRAEPGDGAGLRVVLAVRPGLDAARLSALVEAVRERLAATDLLAERVESLDLRVVPAT